LSDGGCTYDYRALSAAVLKLDIRGVDAGHLGAQPLDELMQMQKDQLRGGALYIDASGAASVATRVRDEWVAWVRANRRRFGALSILVASRIMQLTLAVARETAGAGQQWRIYDDAAAFEADLRQKTGRTA
jgi:hypothetical protein